MKRALFSLACVLAVVSVSAAQRLPKLAAPQNYRLTLMPDFNKNKFGGEETIRVQVWTPTLEIVLNAVELEFQEVTIKTGESEQKANVVLDKEKEQATLKVHKPIASGPATIQIRYTGILNDQLRGFYLGKDEQGRKYAATQFEATDARRAFPSFDEPAYKATFDITVVANKGLTVISNAKVALDLENADGRKHTVRFGTTPKMSTYLVALVVGNFQYIEGVADGIPIRVYVIPGKKELGTFALEAAENIMRYYNQYFGIRYPYGKLDMVALPDFAGGAMENTGCITYREALLLLDDKHAGQDLKKQVATAIAHEMAHQWFGDLVTMQWWDDLWLNEGFATWMMTKPLQAWKPEWNVQLDDVNGLSGALDLDSLLNTHPIHQEAQTPSQILELADGITYFKTAAVLRMLESYLRQEVFRAGVNAYLKQHAYGNATAADFWDAQTKVSHEPVDQIMPTFVEQPGVPFVSVETRCWGNQETVSVAQQRYFYDGLKMNESGGELWQIPICFKGNSFASAQHCELLTRKHSTLKLQGCSPWFYANADAEGFYHSGYSPEALSAIARVAEIILTPAERILLLSDVWASVRVGREPIGDYLATAETLLSDHTDSVQDQLFGQIEFIEQNLLTDADRQLYELWVRQSLSPLVKEVGWEPKPGETVEQAGLRIRLLHALGFTARDPDVVARARRWADRAMDDSSTVNDEVAFESLQIAAINGDAPFYDRIMTHLKTAKTPEEYYAYQQALTSFRDPRLLNRTLDYALSPDARSQDSLSLIGRVMRNPAGQELAWDFVRSHWSNVEKVGGAFGGSAIVRSTASFCDARLRDEVNDFFTTQHATATDRSLRQSLERINYCIEMKERQRMPLASWLQRQEGSAKN